jgi:cell division protein FtsZ
MGNDSGSKLKFHLVEETFSAKIRVVGIGGGGGNALNRMIEAGIEGVDFIAVNTDVQALNTTRPRTRSRSATSSPKGWAPAAIRKSESRRPWRTRRN